MLKKCFLPILMAILSLILLAGCQSAPTSAPVVQPAYPDGQPTPATNTTAPANLAYPAAAQPTSETPSLATQTYPAPGGGPALAPVPENKSTVTAQVVGRTPDPADASKVQLRVKILTSTDVQGLPNQTAELVDQEVDLYTDAASTADLKAGDAIQATVSLVGDEHGTQLNAVDVKKTP